MMKLIDTIPLSESMPLDIQTQTIDNAMDNLDLSKILQMGAEFCK
jgi:hypothetical protein